MKIILLAIICLLMDIVKILGVGLSGFGYLLMYLAYRLIREAMSSRPPQPLIISTINRYMVVCFVMTVTVGIFTFFSSFYKTEQLAKLTSKVSDQSLALDILSTSQRNNTLADSIVNKIENRKEILLVKNEQKKVLDTLSRYISKVNNRRIENTFDIYKKNILRVSDSFQIVTLSQIKIDSLKESYTLYNDSLSKFIFTTIANEKIKMETKTMKM